MSGVFTRRRSFSLPVIACLLALTGGPSAVADSPDDLPVIFNGKDLAGWKVPDPNPFWKVADGVLTGENNAALKGSMLYTEKSYGDFVFETEVRFSGEVDTGIMVRKPELQVQIGISRSLKKDMTGSFYVGGKDAYPEAGRAKDIEKLLKADDWNKIRLQAKGETFTVWINGQQVSTFASKKYAVAAPIGLQIHPGLKMKAEFRNIKAKPLD